MSSLLKCLSCGSADLLANEAGHTCPKCRASYPTQLGVSLFLKQMSIQPSGFEIGERFAQSICRLAGIEASPEKLVALQEIFRHNYHLSDLYLDCENNYYLDRVRAAIDAEFKEEGVRPPIANRKAGLAVNQDIRAEFTAHYLPHRMPAGKTFSRNVRLTNTGKSVLSSDGETPVHLSYHWRDKAGNVIAWDGHRTKLLIDLLPGQSLTMPMVFTVPPKPQPAYLQLTLVQEGVAWLDEHSLPLAVQIVSQEAPALPGDWRIQPPDAGYDYFKDHRQAQEMLFAEIERLRRPGMRVLELGGCCNPQVERMGVEIVNVDIDVQTLQVGTLRPNPDDRIHWIAADAHDLPFVERSFEGIVMFATLHHFVDPIRVLRQLNPLLKEDGFLAVMCEPVGHNFAPAPEVMLNELNQGINEQAFSLEEYHLIFDQAGFEAYDLVAHGHSLKAFLRPSRKPAQTALAKRQSPPALPLPIVKTTLLDRLRSYWKRAG